jgi:hypothetical protein
MKQIRFHLNGYTYKSTQNIETGELEINEWSKQGIVQKAASYIKAEASGLVGSVSLPVIEQRKAACDTCESRKLVGPDEWYCKSCGCPEWERSKLQVKWEMPAATCPLGKWTG